MMMKADDVETVEEKLDLYLEKLTVDYEIDDRDWAWILLRRGIDYYLRSIGREERGQK